MSITITWDETYAKLKNKEVGYCIHKNWGLGIITKIDDKDLYLDFPCVHKKEHKIDALYAQKILYPIGDKSILASVFRSPDEQLIFKFENHPSEIVRTLLDETDDGELKYQDLKNKLRIIYHGLGFGQFIDSESFDKWWSSLLKILRNLDWLYCPLNSVDGFILIVPGTKHQTLQDNSNDHNNTTRTKECMEVTVEQIRHISLKNFKSDFSGNKYSKIYFENSYIIPVLKNTPKGIDVTDALPSELAPGDIIFLQREFSESTIVSVSNMSLGKEAEELRRCAALWRMPVSKLTENATSLIKRLNMIGYKVHENTASSWIRGTLRVAPQPHNLTAIGELCKNAGYPFNIKMCISAASKVELAHRNAGRYLAKYLRASINSKTNLDTLDLSSGITLDLGEQKLVIDFYKVINLSDKIYEINSNRVNRLYA